MAHQMLLSKRHSMRKMQSALVFAYCDKSVVIISRLVEERDATSILTDCIVYI